MFSVAHLQPLKYVYNLFSNCRRGIPAEPVIGPGVCRNEYNG